MNRILVSLFITTAFCLNQERTSLGSTQGVSVRQHPYYAPYIVLALKELATERGRAKTNHFYVSKVEQLSEGNYRAIVYWKENRALIYWEPNAGFNRRGDYAPQYDLVQARGESYLRLDKDVVENPPVNSNYKITRERANEMIRECLKGDRFVIARVIHKHRWTQSNKRMQRRPRIESLIVAPVPLAAPLMRSVRP